MCTLFTNLYVINKWSPQGLPLGPIQYLFYLYYHKQKIFRLLQQSKKQSDILTNVVYSKYQRINISIQSRAIYIYVKQQPVTGFPIQHVMRSQHFYVFRKTHKQFYLIQIYNKLFFVCLCNNYKDTKHLNNFSRFIKTIENIIH